MTSKADLTSHSRVFVSGIAGPKARGHYARRRREHLDAAEFPWVFHGLEREPGGELHWLMNGVRVFQEPSLLYLTGINQPGVSLVLDPTAPAARRETLFLPWKDPAKEFWDGVRLGLLPGRGPESKRNLSFLRELLGVERILPAQELPRFLSELGAKHARLGVFHQAWPGGKALADDPSNAFARRVASLVRRSGCRVESIAPQHYRLRMPLDRWQLSECERAQAWTREAFLELLSELPRLGTEHAVSGVLEGAMLRRSQWGLAFPTICAAGRNAATLHYMKNDEPVAPGSMILLDFGCRSASMHADISRTIPASGRFDPLQEILYGIVLDVQARAQTLARPGATIRSMNREAWQLMEDLLEDRLLSRGGKAMRPYAEGDLATLPGRSKAHARQPHGLSHLMGEQEHDGDPFRLYQDEPLREGMMLSNEPGIYGTFSLRLGGRTWKSTLGIRIEDDLVVVPGGCRNLSEGIPKTPGDLEALIGGRA